MAQNPKYDNDVVNLGYLNKRLGQAEETINNNNNQSIAQIPKNYSTPPNPPYYKDSLLCYGNKIYRCNNTKIKGTFSWNDWSIAATDDTTVSDFIKNTYEIEKLEIQEQIDGKIQTYYQENDPSKEWKTDLEKSKHIGDYWYNTTNDTQWRYNQITTTTPITYGWGQVNIPKSVFDTIDSKKSIYTKKPTSYKKDDLWIIEETLKEEDLPISTEENPIKKGDWVFSISDSDVYDKTHWVKRDEDVPLSYLEQHYYTIAEIDFSLEEIERNTESKITKSAEEISLNVSQKYATKEEHIQAINDFDKQIGTINETIIKQKETLSDLSVEVGEVSASVESVETKTEKLTVDVNGVKESIIPTYTSSSSNIYIEDALNKKLVNLSIDGKSYQKTREGYNLYNIRDMNQINVNYKVDDDDWITLNYKNTTSKSIYFNLYPKKFNIKENTIYNAFLEVKNFSIVGTAGITISQIHETSMFNTTWYISSIDMIQSGILNKKLTSKDDFTTATMGLRSYMSLSAGSEINFTFRLSLLEDVSITTDNFVYEKFGSSPSPDYPSEIISIGSYNSEEDKYLLELNISGKNKLGVPDKEETTSSGLTYSISNGEITINGTSTAADRIILLPLIKPLVFDDKKNYKMSMSYNGTVSNTSWNIQLRNDDNTKNVYNTTFYDLSLSSYNISNNNGVAHYLGFYIGNNTKFTNLKIKFQIEEGENATEYEQYKLSTTQFKLDQPLRSIGDIKDKLYVKNNRLYVERNIGSIIINGNDYFVAKETTLTNTSRFRVEAKVNISNEFTNNAISDYFKFLRNYTSDIEHFYVYNNGNFLFFISNEKAESVDSFKQWLNENNVQADYILATPIVEDLGDFEIPSTYKGINYISTTDNLKPIITLEYVRDTILSDYVENQIDKAMTIEERHYADLTIKDDNIKASVTEVSNNLTEMFENVNQVKQTITSQDLLIEVISKNIDKSTGDIREITTTNGYKFNEDGLSIYTDKNQFNALHDNTGSYYKDGDTILSETTKDGITNRDLELYGIFKYGKTNFEDEPMFIAQLYENENGETGYGHFYNGGGN